MWTCPRRRAEAASWFLTAVFLVVALMFHLLGTLFAALAVHQIVNRLAPRLSGWLPGSRSRWLAIALLAITVAGSLVLAIVGALAFFRSPGSLEAMGAQMIATVEQGRAHLPVWATQAWPVDPDAWKTAFTSWVSRHAQELQGAGKTAVEGFVRILIGLILGVLLSLPGAIPRPSTPFTRQLHRRTTLFARTFARVVSAQVKISAINTLLTGIFLGVVLPACGAPLPLTKTLIGMTFVLGFIPVAGNLMSNTAVVLTAASVSVPTAVSALVFLVLIHKLEYVLNARIVGGEVQARAWEVLAAMIVLEAVFGLPGVIAAPVYYGYLKTELRLARVM